MKFKSPIFTQASGSVAGLTFSHNRGGLYTRARSIPTDPNSAAQQTIRAELSSLSQRWSQTLSQVDRDAWTNYANLTPLTDAFGDELILTGQQMYIRCNTVRIQANLTVVDIGPSIPGNAELSLITVGSIGGIIAVNFDDTDTWANEVGGGINIQTSRNLGSAINFHKSPFRFLEVTLGAASPPSSPTNLSNNAYGTPLVIGLKNFIRVRSFQADGRISGVQIASIVVMV